MLQQFREGLEERLQPLQSLKFGESAHGPRDRPFDLRDVRAETHRNLLDTSQKRRDLAKASGYLNNQVADSLRRSQQQNVDEGYAKSFPDVVPDLLPGSF